MDHSIISLLAIGLVIGVNYVGISFLILVVCANVHLRATNESEHRFKMLCWHHINLVNVFCTYLLQQQYLQLDGSSDWGMIMYGAEATVFTCSTIGTLFATYTRCTCSCCGRCLEKKEERENGATKAEEGDIDKIVLTGPSSPLQEQLIEHSGVWYHDYDYSKEEEEKEQQNKNET